MYHVAAEHAKYLPALREEIDECIKRYGWTKSSIEKMHRLDSFMKETQRMHGINAGEPSLSAFRASLVQGILIRTPSPQRLWYA